MTEELSYREFRIVVGPHGPGWRAFIFAPNWSMALEEIPNTRDPNGRETVLAEARSIVDRLLHSN